MLSKDDKIAILNSMFIVDYDVTGGVVEYMLIENKQTNIQNLLAIDTPQSELDEMISDDGDYIDISRIAFAYGEAEWYQNGEFLGYVP